MSKPTLAEMTTRIIQHNQNTRSQVRLTKGEQTSALVMLASWRDDKPLPDWLDLFTCWMGPEWVRGMMQEFKEDAYEIATSCPECAECHGRPEVFAYYARETHATQFNPTAGDDNPWFCSATCQAAWYCRTAEDPSTHPKQDRYEQVKGDLSVPVGSRMMAHALAVEESEYEVVKAAFNQMMVEARERGCEDWEVDELVKGWISDTETSVGTKEQREAAVQAAKFIAL